MSERMVSGVYQVTAMIRYPTVAAKAELLAARQAYC